MMRPPNRYFVPFCWPAQDTFIYQEVFFLSNRIFSYYTNAAMIATIEKGLPLLNGKNPLAYN